MPKPSSFGCQEVPAEACCFASGILSQGAGFSSGLSTAASSFPSARQPFSVPCLLPSSLSKAGQSRYLQQVLHGDGHSGTLPVLHLAANQLHMLRLLAHLFPIQPHYHRYLMLSLLQNQKAPCQMQTGGLSGEVPDTALLKVLYIPFSAPQAVYKALAALSFGIGMVGLLASVMPLH